MIRQALSAAGIEADTFGTLSEAAYGVIAGRVLKPRRVKTIAPVGQALRHRHIADEFISGLVILLLQRQCLVIDETARTSEAAHIALLFTVGHQFVFVGL